MFQYLNILNYYTLWYAGMIGLLFYLVNKLINKLTDIDNSLHNAKMKTGIAKYNALLVKLQQFCNNDKHKSMIANMLNPNLNILSLINWFIFDKQGKIPLLLEMNYTETSDDNSDDTSDETSNETSNDNLDASVNTEELEYFDTYNEFEINNKIYTYKLLLYI